MTIYRDLLSGFRAIIFFTSSIKVFDICTFGVTDNQAITCKNVAAFIFSHTFSKVLNLIIEIVALPIKLNKFIFINLIEMIKDQKARRILFYGKNSLKP